MKNFEPIQIGEFNIEVNKSDEQIIDHSKTYFVKSDNTHSINRPKIDAMAILLQKKPVLRTPTIDHKLNEYLIKDGEFTEFEQVYNMLVEGKFTKKHN